MSTVIVSPSPDPPELGPFEHPAIATATPATAITAPTRFIFIDFLLAGRLVISSLELTWYRFERRYAFIFRMPMQPEHPMFSEFVGDTSGGIDAEL